MQPASDEVIIIVHYFLRLEANKDYVRCILWLGFRPTHGEPDMVVILEYIGEHVVG